jgi:hypothetical protein
LAGRDIATGVAPKGQRKIIRYLKDAVYDVSIVDEVLTRNFLFAAKPCKRITWRLKPYDKKSALRPGFLWNGMPEIAFQERLQPLG